VSNSLASAQLLAVVMGESVLLTSWSDGTERPFHYVWLRDNCPCIECRHPAAWERTHDPLSISLDIRATSVAVTVDGLLITWPDGHRTTFSQAWLLQHAYDKKSRAQARRDLRMWTSDEVRASRPEAAFDEIMTSDAALLAWLQQLHRYGFTIVKGLSDTPGASADLAQRVAFLRNSNFGERFEVRSEPQPDSLAYTSIKLTAHTDLVSRESQPGVQFLHCLINNADGGESILVDGFAVAEELRRTAFHHWETLTRIPATFRYENAETDVIATGSVIRLDHRGEYLEIRYSNALWAPLDCDSDDVLAFYAAYQAFTVLLRDPRFEYAFRLDAGECEVFDNRRVLHGRNAFDPNSGQRHLQGCYVDTDDYLSRIKVLQRTGDFRNR
jgi:gamma-butyrobetaine dioxygenase